jgi:hypothetical protein
MPKNKKEAEEEAKDWCKRGWGLPLDEHIEVFGIERMTEKKKEQERECNDT